MGNGLPSFHRTRNRVLYHSLNWTVKPPKRIMEPLGAMMIHLKGPIMSENPEDGEIAYRKAVQLERDLFDTELRRQYAIFSMMAKLIGILR